MKDSLEPDLRGTFSLPEKRVRKNRENLLKFFTSLDKHGQPRKKVFRAVTPKAFVTLAQLYLAHQDEIEMIFAYVRRFKQAAGEITEEDIQATSDEIDVIQVMES